MLPADDSGDTYYENADRYVKAIHELIRSHTKNAISGLENQRYWYEVGYITALEKALDIFKK